jgi:hypothetical protein
VNFVATGTDVEDGSLAAVCVPASDSTFPIGTTAVTCTVTDADGLTATGSFTVTVTNNAPAVAPPADLTTPATSAAGAIVSFVATGTDVEDGSLAAVCVPASGSTFPIGTTAVTCTVTDAGGLTATGSFTVTVIQFNQAPVCTAAVANPATLWPPNHKWVAIAIGGVNDPDGDAVTMLINSIFQDEPTDTEGEGNTAVDGKGVGTATASVRAERIGNLSREYGGREGHYAGDGCDHEQAKKGHKAGDNCDHEKEGRNKVRGDGRVYHIAFTASDGDGASCTGEVTVGVPHDKGGHATPIDGGPLYDSTKRTPPPGHSKGDGCERGDHEKGRPGSDRDGDKDRNRRSSR